MCRSNASQSPPARMQSLGPRAFLQEYLNAGSRAGANALSCNQLLLVQIEQFSCRKRGAEVRDDASCMKARVMEASLYRGTNPNRGLNTYGVGSEYFFPRGIQLLAHSNRCWQSNYTG